MRQAGWLLCATGFFLFLSAAEAQTPPKAVKLTQQWKGSVADENLQKGAPEFIANEKALAKLWKDWKIEQKLPKVDFTKEIVLVATTRGSRLNLSVRLHDNGNLEIIGFGTADFGDGFRYVMGTVSREGVKTVNKKELPKG
jgi:hypothetical protein